jgi:hypothetical protein
VLWSLFLDHPVAIERFAEEKREITLKFSHNKDSLVQTENHFFIFFFTTLCRLAWGMDRF